MNTKSQLLTDALTANGTSIGTSHNRLADYWFPPQTSRVRRHRETPKEVRLHLPWWSWSLGLAFAGILAVQAVVLFQMNTRLEEMQNELQQIHQIEKQFLAPEYFPTNPDIEEFDSIPYLNDWPMMDGLAAN
jgi:hypothetical protein